MFRWTSPPSDLRPFKRLATSRRLMNSGGFEPVTLLQAVAEAARKLLTPDFESGLRGALRTLSEGTRMDRVYVVRYDHTVAAGFLVAEHCAPGVENLATIYGSGPYAYVDYEEVWRPLLAGTPYGSSRSEKAAVKAGLDRQFKTIRDYLAPITVDGSFWGVIGFDDCTKERVFREA